MCALREAAIGVGHKEHGLAAARWDRQLTDWRIVMGKEMWKYLLVGVAVVGFSGVASGQQLLEFSLDIGSDCELSDPFPTGNEWFDPGDVYGSTHPMVGPADGFKDDQSIFGLLDPDPDDDTGTIVPVGMANPSDYRFYFDLDGHDQLDFELPEDLTTDPRLVERSLYPNSICVVVPDTLILSFDDDGPPGWTGMSVPGGDVPVTVPPTYGNTDELLSVQYPPLGAIPLPYMSETGVHAALQPNPGVERDDDDVDSLDLSEEDCPFWYFSADHEAHLGLDPGDIYLVIAGGGWVLAVDDVMNLGLPDDTDVDAFEFIWAPGPEGKWYLAVLFSVDQDDPDTQLVDESGGLNPQRLYISFLDGTHQAGDDLGADIDALTVKGQGEPPPADPLEFSLDIGSDCELSDPNMDGDERFDPGDVYHSTQIIMGPTEGFKDDATIFGADPHPSITAGTTVPVGFGDPDFYEEYFDLDGHDQLDIELPTDLPDFPRQLKAADYLPTNCVVVPHTLIFSFDDDGPPGWTGVSVLQGDVPVTVPPTYGTTAGWDELLSDTYPPSGAPVAYADEVTVHPALVPNPDNGDDEDDDVDSLDYSEFDCQFWYFTADHEASLGLDPGDIYLVVPGGPPVLAVDDVNNLGISDDTDVDAFEFVWEYDPSGAFYVLAVLFSVDQDDPDTPGVDESGGLVPGNLYISYLDMTYVDLGQLGGNDEEDVDALTVMGDPLEPEPEPEPMIFEFSLDIGSDKELSDPQMDGDEFFDPGDVYTPWQVIWQPEDSWWKNDLNIFGIDPNPVPGVAGSAVPVGQGGPLWYLNYFDLDGHDQLDFDLLELGVTDYPIRVDQLPSPLHCVYEPNDLYWSYDDDHGWGWCGPVPPGGDVPVTSLSPILALTYGSTAQADEVLGAVVQAAIPSAIVTGPIGVANELMVNYSLLLNPDPALPYNYEQEDDDVDSLDAVPETQICNFWYFTADYEGRGGGGAMPLDPGDIYLANPVVGPGPVLAVDNSQLGLLDGTDVDAFEFVLLERPDMPGMGLYLAVLFSVDDDDLLTAVDESGGLWPEEVYVSFMDGMWFSFLILDDDVDALTVYPQDPVKAPNLVPNSPANLPFPPDPPPNGTLSKQANNCVYLVFDEAIAVAPAPGNPVTIEQLIASVPETLGADLGGSFTYTVQTTNVLNDTLKCKENGSVLTTGIGVSVWYRIKPTANLTNAAGVVPVNMFVYDLCTLEGDGDGSGQVLAFDYFTVKNNMFQVTDNRYDLDGSGQVLAFDYFVVKNNMFAAKAPKP